MSKRIEHFEIKNFGMIEDFDTHPGNITLLIGENGSGKSTVLKALYAAVRAVEDSNKGDDKRPFRVVLPEKLKWTFQVDSLGELVNKKAKEPLSVDISWVFSLHKSKEKDKDYDPEKTHFGFTSASSKQIADAFSTEKPVEGTSILIPAREVLSTQKIITMTREKLRIFGYDDPSYDLARALGNPLLGNPEKAGIWVSKELNDLIDGHVDYDETQEKWIYRKKDGTKYTINLVSDGVKKIAILERLLSNGTLTSDSILFLDEPESSLHPMAISKFLDIIDILANEMGIQVFIASHSYFVIKKLRILAMRRKISVPCISLTASGVVKNDLMENMPKNAIIDESVRLYDEELEEAFR